MAAPIVKAEDDIVKDRKKEKPGRLSLAQDHSNPEPVGPATSPTTTQQSTPGAAFVGQIEKREN